MPDLLERLKAALASRYAVDREIGRGSMAVVFLAEDLRHHRRVAIKVLHPELAATLGAERFLQEIDIAARLDHPHIVALHDSGDADGLLFYVMPYVEGESLSGRLKREGQLPVDEALRIAGEVSDALAYAHEHGVVHRDVKPGNILVSDGHARIADFGVARALDVAAKDRATETGLAVGTPVYMAPEQASGQGRGDKRSDVYSVGCLLYEMLVGEPPYSGLTPQVLQARKMTESAPRVGSVRDTVSPGLENVVARALARVPADRYQTASDLKDALQDPDARAEGTVTGSQVAAPGTRKRRRRTLAAGTVAVLGLIALGYVGFVIFGLGHRSAGEVPEIRSLVVLPLQNLSADPDQEFLVDGMTDALIGELARIGGLDRVISLTTAMRFKETAESLPEIAERLNVEGVMEGSVRRDADEVQIRLRLFHGPTERHVWSEDYVGELEDMFALQRRVSRDVADEIQLALSPAEGERLEGAAYSPDPKAYEAYLKGRHHFARWSPVDAPRAVLAYQEAIDLDPSFGQAYAALAELCILQPAFYHISTSLDVEDCEELAHRALETDEGLSDAHAALGMVAMTRWDWVGAETSFRRAIELDPNGVTAHLWYGWFLSQVERPDESLAEARRAEELDPLNLLVKTMVAQSLMNDHRYAEGLEQTTEVLELDPDYGVAHLYKAAFYALKGMPTEALQSARRLADWAGEDDSMALMLTAWGHALAGEEERALEIVARIDELYGAAAPGAATVYLALGREEEALDWLERSYRAHVRLLPNWTAQPNFDVLRDHPRFRALRRGMGLE